MSIEMLKQELLTLNSEEQRQITAFLVSLQDARDEIYRKKLSRKIDQPAEKFATLDELDRRLKLSGDGQR